MNGEIPSVPITTLAGIQSLTDLLPELPLPSPLPSNNKSLLFHPRVAEEATRLLNAQEENLVPQLAQALAQTSSEHLELKDSYAGGESNEANYPELLKAVLNKNSAVFKSKKSEVVSPQSVQSVSRASSQQTTKTKYSSANCNKQSPYPSPHESPHPSNVSPARYTPQDSPATKLSSTQESPVQHSPYSAVTDQSSKFIAAHKFPNVSSAGGFTPPSSLSQGCETSDAQLLPDKLLNNIKPLSEYPGGSSASIKQHDNLGAPLPGLSNHDQNAVNQLKNLVTPLPGKDQGNDAKMVTVNGGQSDTNSVNSILFEESSLKGVKKEPTENAMYNAKKEMNFSTSINKVDIAKQKPVVVLNKLSAQEEAQALKNMKNAVGKAGDRKIVMNDARRRNAHRKPIKINSSGEDSSDDDIINRRKDREKFYNDRIKRRKADGKIFKSGGGGGQKKRRNSSSGDEYKPEVENDCVISLSERVKRRKRSSCGQMPTPSNKSTKKDDYNEIDEEEEELKTPKPKLKREKKVRKLLCERLTTEELMDTNTFKRFTKLMDFIFESSEDIDLNAEQEADEEEADCTADSLIPRQQLEELCVEAAKLKGQKAMDQVPRDRLVRLLHILERNIRDGTKVLPVQTQEDQDEEESRLWLELTMERVMRSVDASLTAFYIMTSSNMPKQVYLEDVIDRVVMFSKFQLQNTVYPVFDPAYRVDPKNKDGYVGNIKQKRARAHTVKQRSIIQLYNKLSDVVQLLADLMKIQMLPDTTVLQISTLGVSPFFVENVSELQLSALRLVTVVFSKYNKHRSVILEDILSSLARLPSSKRNLRNFRLNSEEQIQMVTALALQLIQCVVQLPEPNPDSASASESDKSKTDTANELMIVSSYENAMSTAYYFLSVFLKKCSGKNNEELDYRPLFENFIQDLLCTVNKPEWPAAEFLLSLLGKLLFQNFSNKSMDMSLRVASLDYLGVVAARLRKDAVSSHCRQEQIDEIIRQATGEDSSSDDDQALIHIRNKQEVKKKLQPLLVKSDKTQVLQKALLDYLNANLQHDPSLLFAGNFFIAQWFKDAVMEAKNDKDGSPSKSRQQTPSKTPKKQKIKSKRKGRRKTFDSSSENEEPSSESCEEDVMEEAGSETEEKRSADAWALADKRKKFLLSIFNINSTSRSVASKLDYESAELVSRFLAAKRPFSKSFDIYLKQILTVLNETAVAVRTKAMKCLASVVEADPEILGRTDMQFAVRNRLLDHSTSVREAAVDLVGKYVHVRPKLTNQYYTMLVGRILDTGVSVRKRVIKILKDICIEQHDFPKIPDICVRIIRRVNDEDGIKKLVHEVFHNMWFTPVKDPDRILKKVMNITDVVAACSTTGYDWFEQLLMNLLKNKDDANYKPVLKSCRQIVDCLVENLLSSEETIANTDQNDKTDSGGNKLVPCVTTLYLFAKICPPLMVGHAMTLQPYLSMKCQTQGDQLVLMNVTRIMELVVPLMDHPSESFLAQLEEDMTKLILCKSFRIVNCCVSCLGAIVNNVTRNYRLIRDSFHKFFSVLNGIRKEHSENPNSEMLVQNLPLLRRSLFTTGLFCQHFDLDKEEVGGKQQVPLKVNVFESLMYFMRHELEDVRFNALIGIGFMVIRHYDFMMETELRLLYTSLITNPNEPVQLTVQVLKNLTKYLTEEETRMLKTESEWSENNKKEDLKEMGDIASGMASTVVQVYLKQILEACMNVHGNIRSCALQVIQLVIDQGLVHPARIVPYLICLSTDTEPATRCLADKLLQDISKKYPAFVQMRALAGVKLSYTLHHQLSIATSSNEVIRGFRKEDFSSLNSFMYSTLRVSRKYRRAFIMSLLKLFDEQAKTPIDELIYASDNLAYFPYQVQDEPLFLIHHIDIMISVSGSNLLQTFKEHLRPLPNVQVMSQLEDDDDDIESVISRLPEDTSVLEECMAASVGCQILLTIKQHLKDMYGFTDGKIQRYSPSESSKVYERPVNRKQNVLFNPTMGIDVLTTTNSDGEPLDEAGRLNLLKKYLEFKQLMLSLDPADEDDDEDDKTAKPSSSFIAQQATNATSSIPAGTVQTGQINGESNADVNHQNAVNCSTSPAHASHIPPINQEQQPSNPSIDFVHRRVGNTTIIIRPPKPSKQKSPRPSTPRDKKKKKKKRKRVIESEEENSDSSDPDWT